MNPNRKAMNPAETAAKKGPAKKFSKPSYVAEVLAGARTLQEAQNNAAAIRKGLRKRNTAIQKKRNRLILPGTR
jgi:hypothetical protein